MDPGDLAEDEVSRTVYRVPRSHYHCVLTNFQWRNVRPHKTRETLLAFLHRVHAGAAPHLLLTGPPGVGKTHLGIAAYRWGVSRVGTVRATWVNVPAFCELVKRGYSGTDADPWDEVEGATALVVLDDLFGRDLSAHEANAILYRLIDTAYQNRAALLVTMNQDVTELTARLAHHEISRLLADHAILPLRAEADRDWRR